MLVARNVSLPSVDTCACAAPVVKIKKAEALRILIKSPFRLNPFAQRFRKLSWLPSTSRRHTYRRTKKSATGQIDTAWCFAHRTHLPVVSQSVEREPDNCNATALPRSICQLHLKFRANSLQ